MASNVQKVLELITILEMFNEDCYFYLRKRIPHTMRGC